MAFTIEDGTGIVDANAYISLAEFDTWFGDRNDTDTLALTDAVKQAAIITATSYVNSRYEFLGERSTSTQELEWPRKGAVVNGQTLIGVPKPLKKAICIYSGLVANGENLYINTAPVGAGGATVGTIKKKKEVLGPLSEETEYFGEESSSKSSTTLQFRSIPEADNMIKKLLAVKSTMIKQLVRM